MIGGLSAVHYDVIPYGLVSGNGANLDGINLIGLKRAAYSNNIIKELSKTVNTIFSSNSIKSKSVEFKDSDNELVRDLCNFISGNSTRGLCSYDKK